MVKSSCSLILLVVMSCVFAAEQTEWELFLNETTKVDSTKLTPLDATSAIVDFGSMDNARFVLAVDIAGIGLGVRSSCVVELVSFSENSRGSIQTRRDTFVVLDGTLRATVDVPISARRMRFSLRSYAFPAGASSVGYTLVAHRKQKLESAPTDAALIQVAPPPSK